MPMNSQVATTRIVRQTQGVEALLDQVLSDHASLIATVVKASVDVEAPMALAHPTLMRLAKVQEAILLARGEMIRAHGLMLKVGQERADVPSGPCPTGRQIEPAQADLPRQAA